MQLVRILNAAFKKCYAEELMFRKIKKATYSSRETQACSHTISVDDNKKFL